MNDLPPGWEWATIGEITETSLGKMLDKKQATGLHPTPYLRNINVRWGTFDLSDLATMDIRPDELERVLAKPGDVIACEGGEPGRAAVWRGPGQIALQKALHRIRPTKVVVSAYLALLLQHLAISRRLEPLFTGTTIKHLPQEKLRLVAVPLPPLREQERIVAAIEQHHSRLDAAEAALASVRMRARALRDAALSEQFAEQSRDFGLVAIADKIGSDALFCDGDWVESKDQDPNGEIRLTQLADVGDGVWRNRSARYLNSEQFDRLGCTLLEQGDVLVARMPDPLGRACVFPGDPRPCVTVVDVAIIRPGVGGPHSEWLVQMINSPQVRKQVAAMQAGTTRKRISRRNLATVEVPDTPSDAQRRFVASSGYQTSLNDRLVEVTRLSLDRSTPLRRAMLAAAFSGRLVPQDPNDEPASVLLDRLRAHRAAVRPMKSKRQVTAT
jgi:type I restriction enzyme S subunit